MQPLLRAIRQEQATAQLVLTDEDDTVVGRIRAMGPHWITLDQVDDAGRIDGSVAVSSAHVTDVSRSTILAPSTDISEVWPVCLVKNALFARFNNVAELVAIHTDSVDTFFVGFVQSGGRALERVLADGGPGGVIPIDVDTVRRVEWGTRYLEGIAYLHRTYSDDSALSPYVEARTRVAMERMLREAHHSRALVHVVTSKEPNTWWSGVVVALADDVVVLHQLDERRLDLDGYIAIRRSSITVVAPDQKNAARQRLLRARGEVIVGPAVRTTSFVGVLRELANARRVVSLEDDGAGCFPGTIASLAAGGQTRLDALDLRGRADGSWSMATRDVMSVEWNTAYLRALIARGGRIRPTG